ncbi:MAG: lipoate--protein ligase [Proteobacteria bacterium]|nr:lipoate--protein ligase [Pseudomonadota bacterium]
MLLRVFTTEITDPFLNLATEEWLFRELENDAITLFLWRNAPCVVIGRGQNPWAECNIKQLTQDQIPLVRRTSGGGTVYHDLGNTNFSFMSMKPYFDKKTHIDLVLTALKQLSIQAFSSSRNDILIPHADNTPRKISGSAYKESKDRGLHHGTLLIHADLNRLNTYLNPIKKDLFAKGVPSVRSSVMNLNELDTTLSHDGFCDALIQSCMNHAGIKSTLTHLKKEDILKNALLLEHAERFQEWSWQYGKTLPFKHCFTQQFDWGKVSIQLTAEKGIISDSQIQATNYQEVFECLQKRLLGTRYEIFDIQKKLVESLPESFPREFMNWFLEKVC